MTILLQPTKSHTVLNMWNHYLTIQYTVWFLSLFPNPQFWSPLLKTIITISYFSTPPQRTPIWTYYFTISNRFNHPCMPLYLPRTNFLTLRHTTKTFNNFNRATTILFSFIVFSIISQCTQNHNNDAHT